MAETQINVTLDPILARVLATQRQIQINHMGGDPAELPDAEKAAFIRTMSFALVAEVIEAADETRWKPWAQLVEGQPIIKNRAAYTSELADVFIFLMNLMLAGDISAVEFMQAVAKKQQINIDRQRTGYDGNNKCPGCKRAYDDPAVNCKPAKAGQIDGAHCDTHGTRLSNGTWTAGL